MEYKGYQIEIKYKNIRRLNARIRDGKILLSAPYFTPYSVIENFIDSNIDKISKIIEKQSEISDDIIHIFGIKYDLINVPSKDEKVNIIDDKCYVFYKKDYNLAIDNYYKKIVKEKLDEIINKYKNVMDELDLNFNKLTIKKMKSRWGSCLASKRNIAINSNLAKYPPICLEYVFCHEIAHIKHQNHSKDFHDFIYSYFKYEKQARKELKKYY